MARLTKMGKLALLAVVLIVVLAIASVIFSIIFPSPVSHEAQQEEGKVKVQVFASSFDRDSVKMVENLRDLAQEEGMKGVFSYEITNVLKSPEIAQKEGVNETPTVSISSEKYSGLQTIDWLREKILEKAS